jgi:predicted ATPase
MLQRLYIHNFKCLENFELRFDGISNALLIGKNGSGKSTIRAALEILQAVARGANRVGSLIKPTDFSRGRSDVPMRFEIEVLIDSRKYHYAIALELPEKFKELRVREEVLLFDGVDVFSRKQAQVTLASHTSSPDAKFLVDWHLFSLPIIQETTSSDPLLIFKNWLAHTIILSPIPSVMSGISETETLQPSVSGSNFGDWFSGLLGRFPAAYTDISHYLSDVMPDLKDFQNEIVGKDTKNMLIRFRQEESEMTIDFNALSDGEKCFFLCAVVLSASQRYGPLLCFWDEPDNYLAVSEVGFFVVALRRAFGSGSQLLITSHNPEAIRKFSNDNTFVLYRNSHLEPTRLTLLEDVKATGDVTETLLLDELDL